MTNRYVVRTLKNGKSTGSHIKRETYEEAEITMLNIVSTISEDKSTMELESYRFEISEIQEDNSLMLIKVLDLSN